MILLLFSFVIVMHYDSIGQSLNGKAWPLIICSDIVFLLIKSEFCMSG